MRTNFNRPLRKAVAAAAALGLAVAASLAPVADSPMKKQGSLAVAAHPRHPLQRADGARCQVEDTASPFEATTVWQPRPIDKNPWQTVAEANPGITDPGKIYAMDMASLRRSGIPDAEATKLPVTKVLEVPVVMGRHALREVACTPAEAATNRILWLAARAATGNTLESGTYYSDPEESGATDMIGDAEFGTTFYSISASLGTVNGVPDTTSVKSASLSVQGFAMDSGKWTTLESITAYPTDGVPDHLDDTTLIMLGGQAPIPSIETATADHKELALLRTAETFLVDTVAFTTGN